jgi:hypothetical protein
MDTAAVFLPPQATRKTSAHSKYIAEVLCVTSFRIAVGGISGIIRVILSSLKGNLFRICGSNPVCCSVFRGYAAAEFFGSR